MAKVAHRLGEPAYVLHSHDWSESSLILELLTRTHGRVVAVAKGAKRPYSQLRPVLMPFQRLHVSFGAKRSEDTEVWLLRQAEWAGGPAWPGGPALLPGFYLNELLMRLTARHDPHPALFDAYTQTLHAMAEPTLLQAGLRAFELVLLRELGHLPDLSIETVSQTPLDAGQVYEVHPQLGVMSARWIGEAEAGPLVLDGAVLTQLEQALRPASGVLGSAVPALMAACVPVLGELKTLLRGLIHYHLGSQTLRTRQLMMELQQP
ncbi:MAG: DNA repair protein RecO [Acidobacteriota bacterium]